MEALPAQELAGSRATGRVCRRGMPEVSRVQVSGESAEPQGDWSELVGGRGAYCDDVRDVYEAVNSFF